ncbi:MAG: DUF357 domain-containing protein [Candidatus Woesearchaeota archaeon]
MTEEKLTKYLAITKQALEQIQAHINKPLSKEAVMVLDMATRYFQDSQHFRKKGDYINAFACLNYAHGWLDAGASLKLFDVHDNRLFIVD